MATTGNIKNVYHGDELEFISTPNAAEKVLAHKGTFFGHLNADSLAHGYSTSVTGRVNGHRYIAVITSTDDWTTSPLRGSEPDFYFLKMNNTTYVGINAQSDSSQMRVANFSGRTLHYDRVDFFNYSTIPTIATSDNVENIYQGEELKFTNSPTEGEKIMLSVGEIYLNNPGTGTLADGYFATSIRGTPINSLTKAGGEYILYLYSDDSEWENMSILQLPGSIRSSLYKVGNNIYIGKFTAVGNETGIGVNNRGTGKTLTYSNYTFAEYAPSFATSDNLQKVYQGSELIWENNIIINFLQETETSYPSNNRHYYGWKITPNPKNYYIVMFEGDIMYGTLVDINSTGGFNYLSNAGTFHPGTPRIVKGSDLWTSSSIGIARGLSTVPRDYTLSVIETIPQLIGTSALSGPLQITAFSNTYSDMYYVDLTQVFELNGVYRIVMTKPTNGALVFAKGSVVSASVTNTSSVYDFETTSSSLDGISRIYAQYASDIKVYRINPEPRLLSYHLTYGPRTRTDMNGVTHDNMYYTYFATSDRFEIGGIFRIEYDGPPNAIYMGGPLGDVKFQGKMVGNSITFKATGVHVGSSDILVQNATSIRIYRLS